MLVLHLTSSTFLGGPERQMLGLARRLAPHGRTVFVSFAEGGRCAPFLDEAACRGFHGVALENDTPHLAAALRELSDLLQDLRPDVVCCHGYKADLLGRLAARRCRIPAVAVSRGWTGESFKIRLYEVLDRLNLRLMDRVVCVSEGQARKVRRCGVPADRVTVIRNAVDPGRFTGPVESLTQFFDRPPTRVVGAAGRLSPEKGFGVFVEAARRLALHNPSTGFVVFGEGPLRPAMERQIVEAGLVGRVVLTGFRDDLDRFLPALDLLVLPSFTEGLPNVVLEAFAAGVPVVATAVGGTPEVVEDGVNGYLVPPGNPEAMARRIADLLASDEDRRTMGDHGRRRVIEEFTFAAQAEAYERLLHEVIAAVDHPMVACSRQPGTLPAS